MPTVTVKSNGGVYENTFAAPGDPPNIGEWREFQRIIKKAINHARQVEQFEDWQNEKNQAEEI